MSDSISEFGSERAKNTTARLRYKNIRVSFRSRVSRVRAILNNKQIRGEDYKYCGSSNIMHRSPDIFCGRQKSVDRAEYDSALLKMPRIHSRTWTEFFRSRTTRVGHSATKLKVDCKTYLVTHAPLGK